MWAKCGHGTPAGRRDTRFSPGIPGFLFVGRSAPTGIRTLTGTILSRLPLPIGLWGQAAGLPAATAAVYLRASNASLRRSTGKNYAVGTLGREAKVSNARRGVSRASIDTMSRRSKKLRNQLPKM